MVEAIVLIYVVILLVAIFMFIMSKSMANNRIKMETEILNQLGFSDWNIIPYYDKQVTVSSRQALHKYDDATFFRENREKLMEAEGVLRMKADIAAIIKKFLEENEYKEQYSYDRIVDKLEEILRRADTYRVGVSYISQGGKSVANSLIAVSQQRIEEFKADPTLLMDKSEYNKYLKEKQKEALLQKHQEYYEKVNSIIDYANKHRESMVIRGSQEQMDSLIAQLFDRTVNSIKKIKSVDSEEWDLIGDFMNQLKNKIELIVEKNQKILAYYESPDFLRIKETCGALMSSQREFNEYIAEKVQSISKLFGTRVVRNATINDDEYNYVRPY